MGRKKNSSNKRPISKATSELLTKKLPENELKVSEDNLPDENYFLSQDASFEIGWKSPRSRNKELMILPAFDILNGMLPNDLNKNKYNILNICDVNQRKDYELTNINEIMNDEFIQLKYKSPRLRKNSQSTPLRRYTSLPCDDSILNRVKTAICKNESIKSKELSKLNENGFIDHLHIDDVNKHEILISPNNDFKIAPKNTQLKICSELSNTIINDECLTSINYNKLISCDNKMQNLEDYKLMDKVPTINFENHIKCINDLINGTPNKIKISSSNISINNNFDKIVSSEKLISDNLVISEPYDKTNKQFNVKNYKQVSTSSHIIKEKDDIWLNEDSFNESMLGATQIMDEWGNTSPINLALNNNDNLQPYNKVSCKNINKFPFKQLLDDSYSACFKSINQQAVTSDINMRKSNLLNTKYTKSSLKTHSIKELNCKRAYTTNNTQQLNINVSNLKLLPLEKCIQKPVSNSESIVSNINLINFTKTAEIISSNPVIISKIEPINEMQFPNESCAIAKIMTITTSESDSLIANTFPKKNSSNIYPTNFKLISKVDTKLSSYTTNNNMMENGYNNNFLNDKLYDEFFKDNEFDVNVVDKSLQNILPGNFQMKNTNSNMVLNNMVSTIEMDSLVFDDDWELNNFDLNKIQQDNNILTAADSFNDILDDELCSVVEPIQYKEPFNKLTLISQIQNSCIKSNITSANLSKSNSLISVPSNYMDIDVPIELLDDNVDFYISDSNNCTNSLTLSLPNSIFYVPITSSAQLSYNMKYSNDTIISTMSMSATLNNIPKTCSYASKAHKTNSYVNNTFTVSTINTKPSLSDYNSNKQLTHSQKKCRLSLKQSKNDDCYNSTLVVTPISTYMEGNIIADSNFNTQLCSINESSYTTNINNFENLPKHTVFNSKSNDLTNKNITTLPVGSLNNICDTNIQIGNTNISYKTNYSSVANFASDMLQINCNIINSSLTICDLNQIEIKKKEALLKRAHRSNTFHPG